VARGDMARTLGHKRGPSSVISASTIAERFQRNLTSSVLISRAVSRLHYQQRSQRIPQPLNRDPRKLENILLAVLGHIAEPFGLWRVGLCDDAALLWPRGPTRPSPFFIAGLCAQRPV